MDNINEIIEFSKKLNVLYVEDNKAVREMTLLILKDLFNKVIVAENGREGIEKFKDNKIDLIISDVTMPIMDGLEMSKEIKKLNSNIPIVILSAHNGEEFMEKTNLIGINKYLMKPLDFEALLRLLNSLKGSINVR